MNNLKDLKCGHVRKFVTLSNYLLDKIFIKFDLKLFRQIVGIPMSTNCCRFVFILL